MTATVDFISDLLIVWQKQRSKKYILITEHGRHPANSVMIDFMWPKIDLLSQISVGDIVDVEYSMNYHEHNDRVYNNIKWHAINNLVDFDQ